MYLGKEVVVYIGALTQRMTAAHQRHLVTLEEEGVLRGYSRFSRTTIPQKSLICTHGKTASWLVPTALRIRPLRRASRFSPHAADPSLHENSPLLL